MRYDVAKCEQRTRYWSLLKTFILIFILGVCHVNNIKKKKNILSDCSYK